MIVDQVGDAVGSIPMSTRLARRRCLWVSGGDADSRESSELALHVLAQSPAGIRASLPARWAQDPVVRKLVQAYRLDGVVDFRTDVDNVVQPSDGLLVDVHSTTPAELIEGLDVILRARPSHSDEGGLLAGHRVVVVTNIPIHYRTALFGELHAKLASAGARLQVIFLAGIPSDRSWIDPGDLEFHHVFLASIDVGRGHRARRLAPRGLRAALDRYDPTIVLSAGFSPFVSGRIARWCSRRPDVAFGVWSGEISSTPTARARIRHRQRRALLHHADFAVAYGWSSARYLRTLAAELPIVIGRNTTPAPASRVSERDSTDVELLVVSRAVPRKRIDLVVEAVRQLALPNLRLTVIGDGPELPNLEASSGSANIRFRGALSPREVRESYTRADILAFPSEYDVFGLVLVEAMAAGLAVVTSAAPGAVVDLAVDEQTCLIVSRPTVDGWREALRRLCLDPDLRRRLGERGRASVRERWTISSAASAMVDGFRLAALTHESGSAHR
jgi:glycosyltransferase involved in cell wall biosynthesis